LSDRLILKNRIVYSSDILLHSCVVPNNLLAITNLSTQLDSFPFFKQRKKKKGILLTFFLWKTDEVHLGRTCLFIFICLFFMRWWWECIKPLELLCAASLELLRKLISVLLCYFFSSSSITSMSFSNVI
jgi:hypothetical protein